MLTPEIDRLRTMPREALFNEIDYRLKCIAERGTITAKAYEGLTALLDELKRRLIAHDNAGAKFPF